MAWKLETAGGYDMKEVSSALQKSVRRGQEREAVFWAMQMESRFHKYLWKRLIVIAHEDIGIAAPDVIMFVEQCKQHYFEMLDAGHPENLPLINAVVAMVRAPKTRVAISLHVLIYETDVMYDIPDEALDMHTERGRKLKRGMVHFHDVASQLVNEDESLDPHKKEFMERFYGKRPTIRKEYKEFLDNRKGKSKKEEVAEFNQKEML